MRNCDVQKKLLCARALFAALLLILMPVAALGQVYFDMPCTVPAEQGLEWTIFDVDEGDAMLLTCGGESMLVDGGPRPFRVSLSDALKERGLTHFKYILNTHYHDDHIDGLYYLFDFGFTADAYLHPYTDRQVEKDKRQSRTVEAAKKNGVPVRRVLSGDTLTLGSAKISIFRCMEYENANGKSLVLRVDYKDTSLLLCADIIGRVQHYYVENYAPGTFDADLIKVPHHALTPVVPEFLEAVSPEFAVVTNREKYAERTAKHQFTKWELPARFSGDGTIRAFTDGRDWYVRQTLGEF